MRTIKNPMKNGQKISDHNHRMLIIGGSGSENKRID